jgi:hypothetical protein
VNPQDQLRQTLLQSEVVSKGMRDYLLKNLETLSEEETREVLTLLQDAETKRQTILTDLEAQKERIHKEHVVQVETALHQTLPAALRKVEALDKAAEATAMEQALSEL